MILDKNRSFGIEIDDEFVIPFQMSGTTIFFESRVPSQWLGDGQLPGVCDDAGFDMGSDDGSNLCSGSGTSHTYDSNFEGKSRIAEVARTG
jgi:hypothetical protein